MKKLNALFVVILLSVLVFVAACTTQPAPLKNPDTNGGNPVQASPSPTNTGGNPVQASPSANDTGAISAGTGTTTPPTVTVKELNIEAYNFGFKVVSSVQINKGDTVKLTVTSTEGTHGFAMPDFNVDLSPIGPGESKTMEFVADKSGTFTYFCNVPCGPGHSSMRGSLIVA